MKKTIQLLCALLFMASTFLVSPAKAQKEPCQDADPTTGACPVPPGGGGTMPINSGVIYLLIAGAVVGIAAIKRQRAIVVKA